MMYLWTYFAKPVLLLLKYQSKENAIMKSTVADIARPVVKIHYIC